MSCKGCLVVGRAIRHARAMNGEAPSRDPQNHHITAVRRMRRFEKKQNKNTQASHLLPLEKKVPSARLSFGRTKKGLGVAGRPATQSAVARGCC